MTKEQADLAIAHCDCEEQDICLKLSVKRMEEAALEKEREAVRLKRLTIVLDYRKGLV